MLARSSRCRKGKGWQPVETPGKPGGHGESAPTPSSKPWLRPQRRRRRAITVHRGLISLPHRMPLVGRARSDPLLKTPQQVLQGGLYSLSSCYETGPRNRPGLSLLLGACQPAGPVNSGLPGWRWAAFPAGCQLPLPCCAGKSGWPNTI